MGNVYTVQQTAEILQLCTKTVREWLKAGILQGSKVENTWFIKEQAIHELLESHIATN